MNDYSSLYTHSLFLALVKEAGKLCNSEEAFTRQFLNIQNDKINLHETQYVVKRYMNSIHDTRRHWSQKRNICKKHNKNILQQ